MQQKESFRPEEACVSPTGWALGRRESSGKGCRVRAWTVWNAIMGNSDFVLTPEDCQQQERERGLGVGRWGAIGCLVLFFSCSLYHLLLLSIIIAFSDVFSP